MGLKQQFLKAIEKNVIWKGYCGSGEVEMEGELTGEGQAAEACEAICENYLCGIVEFIDENYWVQGQKGTWHNPPNNNSLTTKELFQLFKGKQLNNKK